MPPEIYIAVLVACVSIILMNALFIAVAIYLKGRIDMIEKSVVQVQGETSAFIEEGRGLVRDLRAVTARVAKPMDDVEHITQTARAWATRADRLVDAVGTVAEPPLFFMSKNVRTAGQVGLTVLRTFLNRKH